MSVLIKRTHVGLWLRPFGLRRVLKKIKYITSVVYRGGKIIFLLVESILSAMFVTKMVRQRAPGEYEEVERSQVHQLGQGFWE